ncbi:MAG: hypothetical protein ACJAZY_000101 [Spirosomataceae bacterium]|jgi:hypothetical protein
MVKSTIGTASESSNAKVKIQRALKQLQSTYFRISSE